MSIATILELAEEAHPERIAVTAGTRSLAYAHLLDAARAAGVLVRGRGWRHLVLLDANSLVVPVALYGAAYAGVPYVALDERLGTGELEGLLAPLAPALLIAGEGAARELPPVPGIEVLGREAFLVRLRELRDGVVETTVAAAAIAVQHCARRDSAGAQTTSLRHDELLAHVLGAVEPASAHEDDAALVAVPPHALASTLAVLSSTYAGRRLVLLPHFDPMSWLELCRRERASESWVEPAMLERLIDHLEASGQGAGLPALRRIVCGDEAAPPTLLERTAAVLPGVEVTAAVNGGALARGC